MGCPPAPDVGVTATLQLASNMEKNTSTVVARMSLNIACSKRRAQDLSGRVQGREVIDPLISKLLVLGEGESLVGIITRLQISNLLLGPVEFLGLRQIPWM